MTTSAASDWGAVELLAAEARQFDPAHDLTMSLLAVEDRLAKLEEDYARTGPQVVKRLIGAT